MVVRAYLIFRTMSFPSQCRNYSEADLVVPCRSLYSHEMSVLGDKSPALRRTFLALRTSCGLMNLNSEMCSSMGRPCSLEDASHYFDTPNVIAVRK